MFQALSNDPFVLITIICIRNSTVIAKKIFHKYIIMLEDEFLVETCSFFKDGTCIYSSMKNGDGDHISILWLMN